MAPEFGPPMLDDAKCSRPRRNPQGLCRNFGLAANVTRHV